MIYLFGSIAMVLYGFILFQCLLLVTSLGQKKIRYIRSLPLFHLVGFCWLFVTRCHLDELLSLRPFLYFFNFFGVASFCLTCPHLGVIRSTFNLQLLLGSHSYAELVEDRKPSCRIPTHAHIEGDPPRCTLILWPMDVVSRWNKMDKILRSPCNSASLRLKVWIAGIAVFHRKRCLPKVRNQVLKGTSMEVHWSLAAHKFCARSSHICFILEVSRPYVELLGRIWCANSMV